MQKLLLMPLTMLLLAGCQSQPMTASAVTSSDFCLVSSPIRWSQKDTQDTIIQIKKHNAIGIKLCNWKGN